MEESVILERVGSLEEFYRCRLARLRAKNEGDYYQAIEGIGRHFQACDTIFEPTENLKECNIEAVREIINDALHGRHVWKG